MFKTLQLRDFSEYRASAWALIAANLLPLFGVLLLGWDTFSIVALYWVENVIIGAINVLKMIACSPDPKAFDWSKLKANEELNNLLEAGDKHGTLQKLQLAHHGSKLFLVPFFIVHYGLFCMVHGVFVFALFGREEGGFAPFGGPSNFINVFSREHLWWGVLALAASHLWSYFVNFLGHGEYRRTAAPILMAAPYARVVVLHFAILIGGIVSFMLGSNALVLVILVIGKTLLDLSLHLGERARNAVERTDEPTIFSDLIPDQADQAPAMPAASEHERPPVRSSSDG